MLRKSIPMLIFLLVLVSSYNIYAEAPSIQEIKEVMKKSYICSPPTRSEFGRILLGNFKDCPIYTSQTPFIWEKAGKVTDSVLSDYNRSGENEKKNEYTSFAHGTDNLFGSITPRYIIINTDCPSQGKKNFCILDKNVEYIPEYPNFKSAKDMGEGVYISIRTDIPPDHSIFSQEWLRPIKYVPTYVTTNDNPNFDYIPFQLPNKNIRYILIVIKDPEIHSLRGENLGSTAYKNKGINFDLPYYKQSIFTQIKAFDRNSQVIVHNAVNGKIFGRTIQEPGWRLLGCITDPLEKGTSNLVFRESSFQIAKDKPIHKEQKDPFAIDISKTNIEKDLPIINLMDDYDIPFKYISLGNSGGKRLFTDEDSVYDMELSGLKMAFIPKKPEWVITSNNAKVEILKNPQENRESRSDLREAKPEELIYLISYDYNEKEDRTKICDIYCRNSCILLKNSNDGKIMIYNKASNKWNEVGKVNKTAEGFSLGEYKRYYTDSNISYVDVFAPGPSITILSSLTDNEFKTQDDSTISGAINIVKEGSGEGQGKISVSISDGNAISNFPKESWRQVFFLRPSDEQPLFKYLNKGNPIKKGDYLLITDPPLPKK